jgi:acyl CoA:acetate/3-ketoacid CoA transferase alpha subunit
MGPWAWVAFAASGLAQMLTMISTIHSATGYAQGGIVKGNSYSGDNIYGGPDAMVNAGELVLTRAQQANLASNLEGSGGGLRDGQIVATIEGETIVLAAKRWKKRTGRMGENVSFKI